MFQHEIITEFLPSDNNVSYKQYFFGEMDLALKIQMND